MSSNIDNNKRIAKNTLFLYLRMGISLVVSLFTARITLQALGVVDFGIYNVVAGIVVLFTFLNSAMSSASQRFLNFALGKQDIDGVNKVFSMSVNAHVIIAFILVLLAETVGLWLIYSLNFPADRMGAVFWVYQFAILSCVANIIRVPYNATIIAYERMSFYAWISIVDVLMKLVIVYALLTYNGDKLILYSCLLFLVTFLVTVVYFVFCRTTFLTTRYHFFWDKSLFRNYMSFSGWSLFGSIANVGAHQGTNMIINLFCGVVVNAAVGISNQIYSVVGQFLTNFQVAFNPQLVKSYASGDKDYFYSLIFKSAKFSYYLMFILTLPVIINCDYLLHIWLGTVPEYASIFAQTMMVFLLVEALNGPLWISVQATGKIKKYQIIISLFILFNLPFAFLVLFFGFSPAYIFVGRVLISFISLVYRIFFLRGLIHLPIRDFMNKVIVVVLLVTLITLPIPIALTNLMPVNFVNFIIVSLLCVLMTICSIYLIGLTKSEKALLKSALLSKIKK